MMTPLSSSFFNPSGRTPFRVRKIYAYPPEGGKLKTQPEYLSVFLRDAAEARTEEELHRGLRRSFQQLAATGSFKDVRVAILPPAADAPPSSVREGDVHLVLSEGSYGLQAGASINMAGQAEGFYEGRLINVLGQMDSVSVRVSHAQSQLADVSSASSLLRPEGADGGAEELLRSKVNLAREELSHPTVELRFSKPTLGGHPVSLDVYGRAHTASLQSRSAMSVYTQEAGVSSRFAEGTQSVGYFLGRRSVIPARSPTSPFEVVSSPQIATESDSSIVSGLRYSVTKDERSTPVLPASGYLTTGSVEVAGLGGDVAHLKTEARAQANLSLSRYAPDTGYDLPMARGEHASTRATVLKGVPPPPSGLRPHPGLRGWGPRSLLGRLLGVDATNEAALARDRDSYLLADRVAGWLSPGLTLSLDGSAGLLLPSKWLGHRATSRSVDRFFLGAPALRGFAMDGIGPRADRIVGGTPYGDALGGDAYVMGIARMLLPPPLPSVRIANAGVRTQLFACAGALAPGPVDGVVARLAKSVASSIGAGIVVPLGASGALEMNFSFWHSARPVDVITRFQFQFNV